MQQPSERIVLIAAFVVTFLLIGQIDIAWFAFADVVIRDGVYGNLSYEQARPIMAYWYFGWSIVSIVIAAAVFAAFIGPLKSWVAFLIPFEGRVSRRDFWLKYYLVFLALDCAVAVVSYLPEVIYALHIVQRHSTITYMVPPWLIPALVSLWPRLAVSVRRCHDRERSGWFMLVGLIPIFGGLWLLVELGILRGVEGINRFGEDPLAARAA